MGGGIHLLWIAHGVGMGAGQAAITPGEIFATLAPPRIVATLAPERLNTSLKNT